MTGLCKKQNLLLYVRPYTAVLGAFYDSATKAVKCTKQPNLYKMQTSPAHTPISVPLSEFRANTSAMLDLVEKGETVRILRHGKPVAELVPMRPLEAQKIPRWKVPIEPLNYLKPPSKSGAQMIIEERESGW